LAVAQRERTAPEGETAVAAQIPVETVRHSLLALWEEITSHVNNFVLDEGTSLFETLADITAEEASRPVSKQSANLAAQVNHTWFYIDCLLTQSENNDWDGSWQVGPVDDAAWQELIARLRASVEQVTQFMQTFEAWDERYLGGAIALIAHTSYHLGEIRQGIGVLRS
jgi:hypothetical protein